MEQKPSVKSTVGCDLLKRNETEGSCISVQATLEIEDVCEVQTVWIIKFRTMCVCVWQCGQWFQALPTFFTCAAHGLRRFLCTSSPCPCLSTSDALVERCETAGLRASTPVRPMRDGGNAPAARRRGHEVRWTPLDPDHGTRRGWAAARSYVCSRQCGFPLSCASTTEPGFSLGQLASFGFN